MVNSYRQDKKRFVGAAKGRRKRIFQSGLVEAKNTKKHSADGSEFGLGLPLL